MVRPSLAYLYQENIVADSHQVIFYPVGNGDTVQIVLSKGRRVLFDFCHRDKAEDTGTPEIDLKTRLRDDLEAVKRDYFDVVAFTHADLDHIQGSTEFFELQHAKKYQGNGRIKIRELWVPAAMLLENADKDHQSDEHILLRQEARHRLLEGKDILVFSKPRTLTDWLEPRLKDRGEPASARDHLFIDAGTVVPGFTLKNDDVEFFSHSPFIKHCDEGDIIRNSAALMFNVRFNADGEIYDYLEIGDAEYGDLEEIVRVTRHHRNNDRLAWDLFNIPHHCSYRALNEEKGKSETDPASLVKDLLRMGKPDAYIVSCSKPIPDAKESYEQVQPPHIQARKAYERYLREVNGRKFLVTMEEPNTKKPEPIIFEVGRYGITWKRSISIGAPAIITSPPPRAG
ncbi:MAG: hypothetical protein LBR88_04130 [Zoogloeaceae bacterium]|jgi:hypothetical protein|nr:hypothetical protein [Zoogloeaceae bacterium]